MSYALRLLRSPTASSIVIFQYKNEDTQEYQVFREDLLSEELAHTAASNGRLAALQWLLAFCHQIWPFKKDLMLAAAACRYLHILKYVRTIASTVAWPEAVPGLASDHADCLAWLLVQEPPCPSNRHDLCDIAAAGNLPALQHLRLHHHKYAPVTDWDEGVTHMAAAGGHLTVLRWLRSQVPPIPWSVDVCSSAQRRSPGGAPMGTQPAPSSTLG